MTSANFPDLNFLESDSCTKIIHCRDICYTIIITCFSISRFIESYYRYDDVLAVNLDLSKTLSISELYTWLERIFNQVKRDLKEKILPPSQTYEESMETILYNLRAVAVNIDFSMLIPKSYQLEDYHMVFDKE